MKRRKPISDQEKALRRWCYVIIFFAIWFTFTACHATERITVIHTVRPGETLADIGRTYANPNISDPRYLDEFTEGIRENNQCIWNREPRPGDQLQITIWVEIDYD